MRGLVAPGRSRHSFLYPQQSALHRSGDEAARTGAMKIALAYGRGHLEVEFPAELTTVIQPAQARGLADERAAVRTALDRPIDAQPLRDWIEPRGEICILFTDITRATPNERLIRWLLAYLREAGVSSERITLIN